MRQSCSNPMLSCVAYSTASCLMILVNKAAMTPFDFDGKCLILVVQGVIALSLMFAARSFKLLHFSLPTFATLRLWLPVNVLFTLMLYTSFVR
jgi:GDP-mannose transporter